MLTKFAVKNYRGFEDRIEWDLSNPSNYSFNQDAIKDGVVKNGIIYGPNGAGKSNMSLAIFDLILHLTQKQWSVYPLASDHPLKKMKDFVDGMLLFWNHEERGFAGLEESGTTLEEYIIANGLVDDFAGFLKDVSGQEFKFKEAKAGDKQLICDMGDGVPFNRIRSTGTSSLTLLYFGTKKLSKASFVMIDEFDAFYHYALSYNVCKRLFELPYQLFVTSHNTYLMTNDLLRPDCNFIINHNRIKSLNACTEKELRWGNNIEKMYRGNAFEV